MNLNRSLIVSGAFIAASAAIGVWAWLRLPADATIAMHINAHGQMDGQTPKTIGLALLPGISAAVTALLAVLPRITPNAKGLEASAAPYGLLMSGVAAVLLVTQAAIVAKTIDPSIEILRWVLVAVGVLFVLVGNFLGKVRHNYVFGIRTPWTLADATVWDKTHRFTGRLMFLGGAVLVAGSMLIPSFDWLVALLVFTSAGPAITGAIYSRIIRAPATQA